jgi:hypothetical protein
MVEHSRGMKLLEERCERRRARMRPFASGREKDALEVARTVGA